MSDEEQTAVNTLGLDQLLKALKPNNMPIARLGVLNDSPHVNANGKSTKTNAEIGIIHEYGGPKTVQRSWLRVPLATMLFKTLEKAGAFDDAALKRVIETGSLLPYVQKVTLVAEGIVLEGFNTGGYGLWKASDMRFKKNHQTLVETQQLRNAISSEVKENG